MHFIVHCLDHAGMVDTRLAHYQAHKDYLGTASLKTLISGPLTASDGTTMIGSFFLYEADDIEAVKAFVGNDPFNRAGIWEKIDIKPFIKRVDNR